MKSIHHNSSIKYVSATTPALGDTVCIRVRAGLDAPIKRMYLRTFPDGEQSFTPMKIVDFQSDVHWWEVNIRISQPSVHYRFLLDTEMGIFWLSAAGTSNFDPLDATDFQILANYQAPTWLHASVFYQIFPDRFANGNPENDPKPDEFVYRGYRPQTYEWGQPPGADQPASLIFYGGDLRGIIQHLDYLQSLGVTALYLNPIFTAFSNHKYDVVDYDHIDPHLGGDEALIELRQGLNQRRMRYILDIVPNHTGFYHDWFQTARQNPDSAEAAYYTFHQHPDEYESWLGVWMLPKLNYLSAELREKIYGTDGSVFRRWLKPPFSCDGWRIDVANMLARQGQTQLSNTITREIYQAVKSTRADAYLLGENFFDATNQLQGDQLDAVMNYSGFSIPLWHWLRGFRQGAWGLDGEITHGTPWPTTALASAWLSRLAVIPWVIALQQFNVLDSHDTPRIRAIVGGNDALHRLAAIVQFTFPGIPCVYYGDEIGLQDDPQLASRGCMPWSEHKWDRDLLAFYKKLIHLRHTSPILQQGGFQILAAEENTIIYLRETLEGRILIIAHRDQAPRPAGELSLQHAGIPDGTKFREYFTGQSMEISGGKLRLDAHSQGATIWLENDTETES